MIFGISIVDCICANKQLDEIELNRDTFRESLTQQQNHLENHSLMQRVEEWKEESMKKIEQIAKECKQVIVQHTIEHMNQIELNLTKLTEQLRHIRQENDFNELDLSQLKDKLRQLEQDLQKPSTISIQKDSASPVDKISVILEKQQNSAENRQPSSANVDNEALTNEMMRVSMVEIQKRCMKHQKNETEAKRQLIVYQNMIRDMEHQIQDLNERLAKGAEEYRTLFRKYTILEQTTSEHRQEEKSLIDINTEVTSCPVCNWDFPKNLTSEGKQQHIEGHFD